MSSHILVARGLVKRFGALKALNGVSVEVERNKVTLIIGPNGSGKTTLVNVITGVYKPDAGRVLFARRNGEALDITGWPPHRIFEIGIVRTFQVPQVFQKLTVLENLLVAARRRRGEGIISALARDWAREEEELARRAFGILEGVKLADKWDRPAYALSGGETKLLEIARALMAGAELIILDEPLAGIHVSYAHELLKALRDLSQQHGVTLLIIEHRIDIAFKYVDYVYVMAGGQIVSRGTPDEVIADPRVKEAYVGSYPAA
jgi:branched-chain amino acid transport system ATP-binding protein